MDESRLEEIEVKLAFQEQSLQELSDVVYRQERSLEAIEERLAIISERLSQVLESVPDATPEDPPPPHY